ncbi:Uncharacterised protein [Vibrio cholerae]|nr:Uncharacterised protein [Vibrio cholerae]
MNIGQIKACHQHRFRIVFVTDDLNHFIKVEISDQQTLQNVQTSQHFIEAILQT